MKVIQLLPELNEGGVERCTVDMAYALVEAGHTSIVVSNGGRLVKKLEKYGTVHIQQPIHEKSLRVVCQIRKLQALFLKEKPDIVHVRSRLPAWLTFFALKGIPAEQRPKVVSSVHGFNSINAYSAIMTRADLVIGGSKSIIDFVQVNYPRTKNAVLIPEGIDPFEFPFLHKAPDAWQELFKQTYPQFRNKFLIILPARITRLKGHDNFIQLIHWLRIRKHNVHGICIGEATSNKNTYLKALKQKITEKNLNQHITFVGHQHQIQHWLSQAGCVVNLSTKAETFGKTVLESVSLGVPTVAWDRGGVSDILSILYPEGKIEPDQLQDMCQAIINIIEHGKKPQPNLSFLKGMQLSNTLYEYEKLLQ